MWGWTIGAMATFVGVAVYLAGWLDRLDGYNLDLHFRHFNTLQADPRIVVIAIDDSTLQAMPDWPWPRRVFADLVRAVNELSPYTVVLDLVFDLPSVPRTEHAWLTQDYDVDPVDTVLGDPAWDETIYDDDELTDALTEGSNVFLAVSGPLCLGQECAECRKRSPFETPLGGGIGLPTWREYFHGLLGDAPFDAETPDRRAALRKYRQLVSHHILGEKLPSLDGRFATPVPSVRDLLVPFEKLARAAQGIGLASFGQWSGQAVVRWLPMLAEHNDKLIPHLGLAAAAEYGGANLGATTISNGRMVIPWPDDRRFVPLDSGGLTLVNWCWPKGSRYWFDPFKLYSARTFLEIVMSREAVRQNRTRVGLATAEMVRVRHSDTPATFDEYATLINRRIVRERSASSATSDADPFVDARIAEIEGESIEWLRRVWGLWKAESPRSDEETAERERIKKLYDRFGEGQYAAQIDAINKKLEARIAELSAELGPMLKDKIVLVGYTATAMADMVPTPVDPAMPGVMVHANVVNMFLQNRFASELGPANSLLMLLAGAITTLASMRGRTRVSVAVLALLIVAAIGGGAAVFYFSTVHVASFSIAACVLLTWGCVTVYRQATDERSRRKLQRALSQYTSPAVAARIAEQARGDTLAPQTARVTSFFSDLSGFTAMSERLGPQRTREALDPYLREVSAVIMAQGGMVNKFIGDGVFAFFNAPILPCPNHAAAACESALAVASKLRDNPALSIRVGLSTGDAFVGDYGSEQKLDYTCIGDTVNVGQRLERANKFFGTTILTDEATRRDAGDGFVFRPLGLIAVSGRSAPVAIHELVGREGEVSPATLTAIDHFAEAIRCFQTCQWDACMQNLDACDQFLPSDKPTAKLRELVDRLRRTPQPTGWTGAMTIADS